MPLLFCYGTLQQENVQLSTFARLLTGQKDELLGFEQALVEIEDPKVVATSGKTYHSSVRFNATRHIKPPPAARRGIGSNHFDSLIASGTRRHLVDLPPGRTTTE
jgi:hypothetical protein